MLTKKLFIAIGVLFFLFTTCFIFKRNKEETSLDAPIIEEEMIEISKEDAEEAKRLFLEVEKSFYNILENIFLRGEDVTKLLSQDIIEIENNLKNVRENLEEETINRSKLDESLSTIQRKMQLLVEKIIEIDS